MMDRSRYDHRPGTALSIAAGCLLIGVLPWPQCARAAAEEFDQRMNSAVEQAQEELRQESDRIQKEQQARRKQLGEIRATCDALADERVERRLSIARKQQELATLRRRREALWAERAQWQEERAETALICQDVQKALSDLAETLPGSELRDEQNRQLTQLANALVEGRTVDAVALAVALVESFLQEARTAAVYEADIVDPRGMRQRANVLRVGQTLYACHVPATSQTAIAVSAPYEENGFRWHEQLPEGMQQALVTAINRAPVGEGRYWLPMDITGSMTAATGLSSRTLRDRLRSGGVVMIPLAFVAACLTVLIADRFFVLLRESRHSLRFCRRVLESCDRGEFEQAERMAERTRGVLSRTLKVCLAHRRSPPAILDDAIQETFLHEFPRLERFLPSIRMLSSVAPMLGLLGTVTGIIATFDIITVVGSGRPRLMAGGISEALITTATGLAIAIPGLLAHSVLSGRVDGIVTDTERFAATLSNLLKKHQHAASNGRDK